MKIRAKLVSAWVAENRGIAVDEVFDVIETGVSREKSGMTFYFIEKNNKPIVLYEDEVEIVDESISEIKVRKPRKAKA